MQEPVTPKESQEVFGYEAAIHRRRLAIAEDLDEIYGIAAHVCGCSVKELSRELRGYLCDCHALCVRCAGKLLSRQIIAKIVLDFNRESNAVRLHGKPFPASKTFDIPETEGL